LLRFIVEYRDLAFGTGSDYSGRKILEQNLVVYLRVLDLGEKLRIIDGDGELSAEDLECILFNAPINAAGQTRTQKHDARHVFARKNAHGHCDIERGHLFLDGLQFRGLPHPVQLVENEDFLVRFEVGDHRLITAHS
jgi:hypothetical protein